MKRQLLSPILIALLTTLLFACSGGGEKVSKKELRTRIDTLRQSVDSMSSSGKLPKKKMKELKADYKSYADRFSDDSLSPHYLFRAGSLARSLKEPQKAINLYTRILEEYPDYEKEATVRFLLAFVYDQDLDKKKKARSLYQAVIDSFPDHKLAKDAKQYLKVMDLSDKELIERFEKQQEKRDSAKNAQKDSAKAS